MEINTVFSTVFLSELLIPPHNQSKVKIDGMLLCLLATTLVLLLKNMNGIFIGRKNVCFAKEH